MTRLGLCLALLVMMPLASAKTPLASASAAQMKQQSSEQQRGVFRRQEEEEVKQEISSQQQKDVEPFHLWSAHEFPTMLLSWEKKYMDLIRVTTAQEKYGLPTAGGANDCPFATETDGCPNYIFTIQDFVAHPEGSESSKHLPEVFWSGCLHGNERVGPTATMEAATLLLEAARCESLPRRTKDPYDEQNSQAQYGDYQEQMEEAKECRKKLKEKGVDDAHRKWLARLVTTRRIVVVPTSNALGYFQNRRTEGSIDPNRDFPYDLKKPELCMQTIAGRTLNEVYREHMFQLALTFHAGMEVVSYEWGAPTWLNHFSPDDEAQSQIGSAYSRYGGGWSKSKPYKFGTMNDLVYYVRGGMEDWAYAGSFDPDRVIECEPKTFGGYPKEKTKYNNSTLRVFNMLIETSDNKEPRKADLGTSLDVLNRDTKGNGHVSRNVRLALLAADMVEPYVSIVGVNKLALSDDILPLSGREDRSCQKSSSVMVAKNVQEVEIKFTVGGAMSIDNAEIWYAKWEDIPKDQLDCLMQPKTMEGFTQGTIISAKNGTGFFARAGSHPRPEDGSPIASTTNGPVFTAKFTVPSGLKTLDQLVVVASARVDQDWAHQPANVAPIVDSPQSHVVNARTNPNWRHESGGKVIQGRLDWFSTPLTVVIGDFTDGAGTQGAHLVRTIERYPRFGENDAGKGGMRPKSYDDDQLWFPLELWHIIAGVLLLLAGCMCCMMTRQTGQTRTLGKKSNRYANDDEFVFDSQPYSDHHALGDDDSDGEVELPALA